MVFRRIIFNALLVGLLAGLLFSVAQLILMNPIIFAAEGFEHDHSSHDHNDEDWAPSDGGERTFYTVVANVCASIGFAAILLALMSQLQAKGLARLTVAKGLLWGSAGYAAFFVAPGIGLPPEIPGIEAAAVAHRQWWWLLAALGVGGGLLMIAYAPVTFKGAGVALIALPYLITIPHHEGPAFTHPDPAVVETLTTLHEQFIIASGFSNLLLWLTLGAVCAWLLNRNLLKGVNEGVDISIDANA